MKIRTISGAVFVAIITGFFLLRQYVDYRLFNILITFFCIVGTFEVARAIKSRVPKFCYVLAIIYGCIILPFYAIIEYFFAGFGHSMSNLLICAFIITVVLFTLIKYKGQYSAIQILPFLYPAILLLSMASINNFVGEKGFIGLLIIFIVSPISDTFAYLVGMTYNKIKKGNARRLCPRLSPKKTVAGAIGGLVGGIIASLLIYFIFKPNLNLSYQVIFFAIVGLFASIFTMIGDLLESAIKRYVGIKDIGKIMPGHGGVMDRVDGISFASLFIFIVFLFI